MADKEMIEVELDRSYLWKNKIYNPGPNGRAEVPAELAERVAPKVKAAREKERAEAAARREANQGAEPMRRGNRRKATTPAATPDPVTKAQAQKLADGPVTEVPADAVGGAGNDADTSSTKGSTSGKGGSTNDATTSTSTSSKGGSTGKGSTNDAKS